MHELEVAVTLVIYSAGGVFALSALGWLLWIAIPEAVRAYKDVWQSLTRTGSMFALGIGAYIAWQVIAN